jgi:VanZ family protein
MSKSQITRQKSWIFYIKVYLPSVLWAMLIFILSDQTTLPGFKVSVLDFIFKKIAHMLVYAVLYYLIFRAYLVSNPAQSLNKKHYLWPLFLALFYAMTDELHQSTVKGRYASTRDFAYDFLGMVSVLLHQQKML